MLDLRKLVLFIATSLDSYSARPDSGMDWLDRNGGNLGHRYANEMNRHFRLEERY